jgi:hypothetical protein
VIQRRVQFEASASKAACSVKFIPFDIASATPGFLVKVTVTVTKKGHPARTCKTSFRPHG